MANNKKTGEKTVTKYDQKIEKRKQQEAAAKKDAKTWKVIGLVLAIVIVGAIIASIAVSASKKKAATSDVFMKVGDHEVTTLEYNYYYNLMTTTYLNTYGSMVSYFGLDTSKDFAAQQYSDDLTWKDYFDKTAVLQIKETKAVLDDAKANGFTYDGDEDYNTFVEGFKTQAQTNGLSVAEYYKQAFGEYATEKNLEPFIRETLYVEAYLNDMLANNKPTDAEISEYYAENQRDLDVADYRLYLITPEIAADAEEAEVTAKLDETRSEVEKMYEKISNGESFQAVIDEYEGSEAQDEDTHLLTQMNYSVILSLYSDWVFDDARTEGDTAMFEDTENNRFYLVQFVKKYAPENVNDTISSTLASNVVNEYKEALTGNYTVTDIKGELNPTVLQ